MLLRNWQDLPDNMKVSEVKPYYDGLKKKQVSLFLKRAFDIIFAAILLALLFLPFIVIAVCIKCDTKGPVFYRQERVTQYGKIFRIHKFRTMVDHADQIGTQVTICSDARITKVGHKLRHLRIDEWPQLIDVLQGTMSFVGTRPEVVKYVNRYEPEYMATLLLPAGITSKASVCFKDEERLLSNKDDVDKEYIEKVLPVKMKYNLMDIREFSLINELKVMFSTVFAVLAKD